MRHFLFLVLTIVFCLSDYSAKASSLSDYKILLPTILTGKYSEKDITAFRSFLGPVQFTNGAKSFIQGASVTEIPAAELYLATPSNEIIYDFLSSSLNNMVTRRTDLIGDKGTRGRFYAWYWGYWGRAVIYMYRATGENRFLDLFVNTFLTLLAERDDRLGLIDNIRGKIVPSWGTLFRNGIRSNEVTTAGLITLPVCEFIRLAEKDSAIQKRYEAEICIMQTAARETLSAFVGELQQVPDIPGRYFYHLAENYVEPLNHSHVFGAALVLCGGVDQKIKHNETVVGLSKYFKASITVEPTGAYVWPYRPRPGHMKDQVSEAIWKAGVTIELPIAAHREGVFFTDQDILGIVKTLTENIDRGGRIAQFLSIKQKTVLGEKFENTSLPAGLVSWIMLEDHAPQVRKTILDLMVNNIKMFPGAWFGGRRVMPMALAMMLWHNKKAGRVPGLTTTSECKVSN